MLRVAYSIALRYIKLCLLTKFLSLSFKDGKPIKWSFERNAEGMDDHGGARLARDQLLQQMSIPRQSNLSQMLPTSAATLRLLRSFLLSEAKSTRAASPPYSATAMQQWPTPPYKLRSDLPDKRLAAAPAAGETSHVSPTKQVGAGAVAEAVPEAALRCHLGWLA